MITIYIADDHFLIRDGLKKLFERESDITVAGEGTNADEVIDFVNNHPVDIIILDINLPGKNGLEILDYIKRIRPEIKVLILSMYSAESYGVRAIRSGASGYMNKEKSSDELLLAVRKIAEGRRYVSPELAEKLAEEIDDKISKTGKEALSNRELEVLLMYAKGASQAEIAESLSVSPSSVSTYRSRIMKKLGISTNAELIMYAVQNKLI